VEIVAASRGTSEAGAGPAPGSGGAVDPTAVDPTALATRQRVLRAVVHDGPVTAADLSASIGLTPAAVRRHLDALVGQSLVVDRHPVRTGGRGRPARAYTATDSGRLAASSSGNAVAQGDALATVALRHLAAVAGRPAVLAVAQARARALAERYAGAVEAAGPDLRARAGALAHELTADGYAATSRAVLPAMASPEGRGARPGAVMAPSAVQLCQGACPVQPVAAEFPELCEAETELFAQLLGTHVRGAHVLAVGEGGEPAHVCTTHVPLFTPAQHAQPTQHDATGTTPTGGTSAP